jgi:hypothetical protein
LSLIIFFKVSYVTIVFLRLCHCELDSFFFYTLFTFYEIWNQSRFTKINFTAQSGLAQCKNNSRTTAAEVQEQQHSPRPPNGVQTRDKWLANNAVNTELLPLYVVYRRKQTFTCTRGSRSEVLDKAPAAAFEFVPRNPIDYRCDNRRFRLSAHNCQVPTPTSQNLELEQQIRTFGAD